MFTGIVERAGVVAEVREHAGGVRLVVGAGGFADDARPGDSICVSGVCLTVTELRDGRFAFDVVRETLMKSNLGQLRAGDRVNLEASLKAGDRIGGHFVQGHVDAMATVARVEKSDCGHVLWLRPPGHLWPYIIPKGSIAVDGVSLTIADVQEQEFSIALIPTTLAQTTLGELRTDDLVNIETDMIVRSVVNYLQRMTSENENVPCAAAVREDSGRPDSIEGDWKNSRRQGVP